MFLALSLIEKFEGCDQKIKEDLPLMKLYVTLVYHRFTSPCKYTFENILKNSRCFLCTQMTHEHMTYIVSNTASDGSESTCMKFI